MQYAPSSWWLEEGLEEGRRQKERRVRCLQSLLSLLSLTWIIDGAIVLPPAFRQRKSTNRK